MFPSEGGLAMELLPYYLGIGLIIFIVLGLISGKWSTALWLAAIWPLWVGFLLISLFWGAGEKL